MASLTTTTPPFLPVYQAVYARREAIDHLERLLHNPDSLHSIHSLIDTYTANRTTTKEQLNTALTSHMAELRSGLESLEQSREALKSFETRFASIEALCAECSSLVPAREESMRRLGAVHSSLRHTIQAADTVASLPRQAADAERILSTESSQAAGGLLTAYVALAELEATVVKVQIALQTFKTSTSTNTNTNTNTVLPSLEFYFTQVSKAVTRVEEKIWSTIRAFRSVAKRNPSLLVAAVQAIEVQEGVDRQLLLAGHGGSRLRKGWRSRCMQHLRASIQESFAPLLQRCSKLLAEDAAVAVLLRAVLADASVLVDEVRNVRADVAPCFPPHYAVLDTISSECHAQVTSMLDLMGLCSPRFSNGDILHCVQWVEGYCAKESQLGTMPGVEVLITTYVQRVQSTLEKWVTNIVASDFAGAPAVDPNGRLWTPGPVDLYRIVDEQVSVAEPAGGELLQRVCREAATMLRLFQEETKKRWIGGGVGGVGGGGSPREVYCAIANNSLRCTQLGEEFVGKMGTLVSVSAGAGAGAAAAAAAAAPSPAGQKSDVEAEHEEAKQGFRELGDVALSACVEAVFSDPGFAELFGRVGFADGWVDGTVTGSVLATLEDFMTDFEVWLHPPLLLALGRKLLAETTVHFIAATTLQLRQVREEEVRALKRDVAKIKQFYGALLHGGSGGGGGGGGEEEEEARIAAECQPLVDIIDFLSSDSVESFVLSYSTLLDSAPGISPVLLSNLLAARLASSSAAAGAVGAGDGGGSGGGGGEMTKADVKEIMEACRHVYNNEKKLAAAGGGGSGSVVGGGRMTSRILPGSRDAAFLAALNAARRKK